MWDTTRQDGTRKLKLMNAVPTKFTFSKEAVRRSPRKRSPLPSAPPKKKYLVSNKEINVSWILTFFYFFSGNLPIGTTTPVKNVTVMNLDLQQPSTSQTQEIFRVSSTSESSESAGVEQLSARWHAQGRHGLWAPSQVYTEDDSQRPNWQLRRSYKQSSTDRGPQQRK